MTKYRYGQEIKLHEATTGKVPSVMGAPTSIDAYRHYRMYSSIKPLVRVYAHNVDCLTIGDGGADAFILKDMGFQEVTSSSISDARLKELKEKGYLPGIETAVVNAEDISLGDQSVGLILCKEAFHHFPKAPLAFYEFMRVSRVGFLLIEPTELPSKRPLDWVRTIAKMVLRQRGPIYEKFEPVGNYIYRLSEHEVYRMLTALQIPNPNWYAVKYFNDFSMRSIVGKDTSDRKAMFMFKLGIFVQNFLCKLRLMTPGFCAIFVPTQVHLFDEIDNQLRMHGYKIVHLPICPYSPSDYKKKFVGEKAL